MTKNETIKFESERQFEVNAEFMLDEEGDGMVVSVSEVQAAGCHNETFECTIHLTRTQAEALRNWLAMKFPPDLNQLLKEVK